MTVVFIGGLLGMLMWVVAISLLLMLLVDPRRWL